MSESSGFLPNIFVMTFYVNGIKQQKEQKYTVEILVYVEEESLVRKFLQAQNILILSVKEFTSDEKAFGDITMTVHHNNQDITILSKYTDIEKACEFFSFIGFDIQTINSKLQPISPAQSAEIIAKAKEKALEKQEKQEQAKQEQEAEKKKIYADDKLASAKEIILRVFEKVAITITRAEAVMDMQDMKKLTALTEELKKLRMGTNFEKISEVIQEIFALMEKIDTQRFDAQEAESELISPESVVRLTDVDRELERMENTEILKSIGAKIPLKNKDYAAFGSSAIFWKFLQKDMFKQFANVTKMLSSLYDIAEFVLLVVVSLLAVYTLFNQIYMFSVNQFGLAYSLMVVGLRGMVIFAARYFRNKNIGRLLLVIVVAILLHYVLLRAVTTNFAL